MTARWAPALLLLLLTAACGGRRYAWQSTDPKEDTAPRSRRLTLDFADPSRVARLEADVERLWRDRDQVARRTELLARLEDLLQSRGGDHYPTLVRLARVSYLEGVDLTDRAARRNAFQRGMHWADLALYTFPAFKTRFEETGDVEEAVAALDADAVEGIYWNAVNLGKWAKAEGLAKVLLFKDKARVLIERVRELNPTFFYGAADRYLGAYYSALPAIGGRDLERSRRHFEQALAHGKDYLGNLTLMAEYYAVAADDVDLYRTCLSVVLASPEDSLRGAVPEQRLAKRQAARMLAEIEDLFDVEDWDSEPDDDAVGHEAGGADDE